MIALWFKLQRGLCWTDLIIVQCSETLTGNYPVGQVIYLFNNVATMAMTFVSLHVNMLSFKISWVVFLFSFCLPPALISNFAVLYLQQESPLQVNRVRDALLASVCACLCVCV